MKTRLCLVTVFLLVSCLIASAQEKGEESAQETLPKPDAVQSEMKAAAAAEFATVGLAAPTISWVKVAFETGVKYTAADQIGVTNLYCPAYGYAADWFSTFIAWDSTTWNTITNGAKAQNVYLRSACIALASRKIASSMTWPKTPLASLPGFPRISQTSRHVVANLRMPSLNARYAPGQKFHRSLKSSSG